ncbi:hypothetical protein LINGRAHAP2_LOCUS15775 [Linum grandiflorum]
MVLRREQVFGNRVYTTKARFGGANRQISIDCCVGSDARLSFAVDGKRVLQIKRLKWKFRGNERIEVGGVPIQISWDVYNWLFEDGGGDAHAVFMFRFEEPEEEEYDVSDVGSAAEQSGAMVPWRPEEQNHHNRMEEDEEGVDEEGGGEEFVVVVGFDVVGVVVDGDELVGDGVGQRGRERVE